MEYGTPLDRAERESVVVRRPLRALARREASLGPAIELPQDLGRPGLPAPQDNSLGVYSVDEFEAVAARLLDQVRAKEAVPQTTVAFASKSVISSIDKAGRITIPERLRSYANLSDEVIVAGVLTHVQIWDRARYDAMQEEFDDVVENQFQNGGAIN